jgi:hyperosmotically inducible protein
MYSGRAFNDLYHNNRYKGHRHENAARDPVGDRRRRRISPPPTAALNHDPATYRNVTQKAAADYKAATAKCGGMNGNDKDVCMAEAKAVACPHRVRRLSKYNNSPKAAKSARSKPGRRRVRRGQGQVRRQERRRQGQLHGQRQVGAHRGAGRRQVRRYRHRREHGTGATGASGSAGLVASTDTKDPAKAAAVAKCEQGGTARPAAWSTAVKASAWRDRQPCRERHRARRRQDRSRRPPPPTRPRPWPRPLPRRPRKSPRPPSRRPRKSASTVAQKTENAAENVGDKTRDTPPSTPGKPNAMRQRRREDR